MHLIVTVRLLLATVSLAFPVRCDPVANQGFTFPRVSNPSIPDVSNLTVRNNDSMVVEYTQFAHTTAIGIDMECNKSAQAAVRNEVYSDGWTSNGPYENNGKIKWDFNISQADLDANLTFCRFLLFNESIASCSWGPWGLVSQKKSANHTIPLFYSPIFRVLAYNKTQKPALWINVEDRTTSSRLPSTTATSTVNVTCPPSGIPSLAGPVFSRQDGVWPPMAENLTFPVYSLDD
ncbi:uncharacterized protein BP5553_00401 [Venustampulla echinocandica]|uniref:Ubiquitin 3 binding protein But2 C-terminal domain-containing protein n=1 Tax=Venustampulla echinocandica TaxID=2656787 RepID=A0A370TY19_9HELO|nr:uncharacterized protein BP5553_00401 [Venustampulla echinocandica]RDL40422.1 hypothetical protein BP5553_00401 [Venustampulla echinocandica]